MMIHCKNCKKKFYLIDEGPDMEGKLIKCKHCNEQWIYETKTKYLENSEMDKVLKLFENYKSRH